MAWHIPPTALVWQVVSNKAEDGSTRVKMYIIHVSYKTSQVNNNKYKVQGIFNMFKACDHIEFKYKQEFYKGTTIQWWVFI